MFRTLTALGALGLFATVANAQPGRPGNLPLSPGVMPASPFGPGMPMARPNGLAGQAGIGFAPTFSPWNWGTPPLNPFLGVGYPFAGFAYPIGGYYAPPTIAYAVPQPVVVEQPRLPDPIVAPLVKEFPAKLTLQFPAAADVWLDGKKVEGTAADERVLTSPVLKAGDNYTFQVKARWTSGGKTYEAKRSVTLGSGDRSRLLVVSGDEVRD